VLSLEEDLGRIDADRTRLRELFANLFRNAAEHGSTSSRTQSGDSVEYGSTSSRPMADDSVEHGGENGTVTVGSLETGFLIADDGPGIAAADREAVFEHGFTTSADGTGFGLAIVETIAEAHGWTVSVAESESGGARFDIEK
jgi:signal transduction histidine kinase